MYGCAAACPVKHYVCAPHVAWGGGGRGGWGYVSQGFGLGERSGWHGLAACLGCRRDNGYREPVSHTLTSRCLCVLSVHVCVCWLVSISLILTRPEGG